jgi:hypothetical protein
MCCLSYTDCPALSQEQTPKTTMALTAQPTSSNKPFRQRRTGNNLPDVNSPVLTYPMATDPKIQWRLTIQVTFQNEDFSGQSEMRQTA